MKGTKGTSQRRYESSIENIVIKILENCQTYLGTFSWNIKNTVSIYFASCIISHRRICLWSMLVHPVGACNYRVMQKSFMHCHHIFWVCFDYEKEQTKFFYSEFVLILKKTNKNKFFYFICRALNDN